MTKNDYLLINDIKYATCVHDIFDKSDIHCNHSSREIRIEILVIKLFYKQNLFF